MTLDLLKRPVVFGTIIGVIVIALVWWFAWMSPEAGKLSSDNAQAQALQTQVSQMTTEVGVLKAESEQVKAELPYLGFFSNAIPPLPESGVLTQDLYELSLHSGTNISSLNDATTTPTGTGYSAIPVTLTMTGSHDSVLTFLKGIYTLPRLLTVQQITLAPPALANLNQPSKTAGFTATITATAYTTYVPPVVAAS